MSSQMISNYARIGHAGSSRRNVQYGARASVRRIRTARGQICVTCSEVSDALRVREQRADRPYCHVPNCPQENCF